MSDRPSGYPLTEYHEVKCEVIGACLFVPCNSWFRLAFTVFFFFCIDVLNQSSSLNQQNETQETFHWLVIFSCTYDHTYLRMSSSAEHSYILLKLLVRKIERTSIPIPHMQWRIFIFFFLGYVLSILFPLKILSKIYQELGVRFPPSHNNYHPKYC